MSRKELSDSEIYARSTVFRGSLSADVEDFGRRWKDRHVGDLFSEGDPIDSRKVKGNCPTFPGLSRSGRRNWEGPILLKVADHRWSRESPKSRHLIDESRQKRVKRHTTFLIMVNSSSASSDLPIARVIWSNGGEHARYRFIDISKDAKQSRTELRPGGRDIRRLTKVRSVESQCACSPIDLSNKASLCNC